VTIIGWLHPARRVFEIPLLQLPFIGMITIGMNDVSL